MALGSTVHTFEIAVSDIDRGVYEQLSMHVARHPSETAEYLVARILAYALEIEEGIAFTAGLAAAEEPAIEIRDLTGERSAWIEVGTPGADRLHRASRSTARVVVYCHKDPEPWLRQLASHKPLAPDRVHLLALDRQMVARLADGLQRRSTWSVSRTEGELYVDTGEVSISSAIRALPEG